MWTNYIQTTTCSLYTFTCILNTHTQNLSFSHFIVRGSTFSPQTKDESLRHRDQVSGWCSVIWVTPASLELKTKATILRTFTAPMISSYTSRPRLQQHAWDRHTVILTLGEVSVKPHALILLKGTYHPFEFTSSGLFLQISHNLLQSYLVCFQSVLLNGIFVTWFSF